MAITNDINALSRARIALYGVDALPDEYRVAITISTNPYALLLATPRFTLVAAADVVVVVVVEVPACAAQFRSHLPRPRQCTPRLDQFERDLPVA